MSLSPPSGSPGAGTVAWVLAAGLGTRLRPLSAERPKPLLEVCGRALIVHTLQLLKDAGIVDVALNSHWLHPQIPAALGSVVNVDGTALRLRYTHEPQALGTGGGLLGLRHVLPSTKRVLVANADALIDLDVRSLLLTAPTPLSTLVLKAVPDVAAWGAIGTDDDDRIVTFAQRISPLGRVARERMFCGWHYMQPWALDVLPGVVVDDATAPPTVTGPESCINKEGYPTWLNQSARLYGFDHSGFFFDVGTAERLWEANRLLLSGDLAVTHLRPFARFVERPGRVFVHPRARVHAGATLQGPLVIDDGCVIEDGVHLGPFAVIGAGVVVKAGTRVMRSVVQSNALVVDGDAVGVHVGGGAPGSPCRVPIG